MSDFECGVLQSTEIGTPRHARRKVAPALTRMFVPESKDLYTLRSGWRGTSLSGFLTVKGTVMREQGLSRGGGRIGEICAVMYKFAKILRICSTRSNSSICLRKINHKYMEQ